LAPGTSGNGQSEEPKILLTDASGNIWILDSVNYRVEELNSSGSYLRQFGLSGTGNGQFGGTRASPLAAGRRGSRRFLRRFSPVQI
jgi:hypothetical protein